jgi:membrane-bound serine protease (ClpP class)
MGPDTIIGEKGVARSPLNPRGFVMIKGEYWQAETEEGEVQPGEEVIVVGREGLRLKVRKRQGGEEK